MATWKSNKTIEVYESQLGSKGTIDWEYQTVSDILVLKLNLINGWNDKKEKQMYSFDRGVAKSVLKSMLDWDKVYNDSSILESVLKEIGGV